MCIYTYIYIINMYHNSVYLPVYPIYTFMQECMYVCIYEGIYISIYVGVCVYIYGRHKYIGTYVVMQVGNVGMYIYLHIYLPMYIYIYLYTYTHLHIYTPNYMEIYIFMVCIYRYTYIHLCRCIYTLLNIQVGVCTYIYMPQVYTYINSFLNT